MWLHYYVLKDMCLGVYFQDAFVCYGHGSSELIILNHHRQQYSWHRAECVHVLNRDSSKPEHMNCCCS